MSISINPHLKVTNQTQHNFFFVEKTVAVFLGDNLHNIKKTKQLFKKMHNITFGKWIIITAKKIVIPILV